MTHTPTALTFEEIALQDFSTAVHKWTHAATVAHVYETELRRTAPASEKGKYMEQRRNAWANNASAAAVAMETIGAILQQSNTPGFSPAAEMSHANEQANIAYNRIVDYIRHETRRMSDYSN